MSPDLLAILHRRVDAEFEARRPQFQQEYTAIKHRMAARGTLHSSMTGQQVAELCVDELNARGEIVWRLTRDSLSRMGVAFDEETENQTKTLVREKLPPNLPDLYQYIGDSVKGIQHDGFKIQIQGILKDAYDNLLARLDADIDLEQLASISNSATHPSPMSDQAFDVFICHASEDKENLVRPLAELMTKSGIQVWYDEYSLRWGDRLRRSIDKGLSSAKYGVVVLSPAFFAKEWPQRELDGLTALELDDGRKRILPLWHDVDAAGVRKYSPTLGDVIGIQTTLGVKEIVGRLMEILRQ